MKMKLSCGGHNVIWSMFHMVVLVFCFQRNVSSDRAQGCVGSQLSLRCPETKVIQITAVVLGDSSCLGASCCIKDSDCTQNANTNHRQDVHRACRSQRECSVEVIQEKISCGYLGWHNNDFERITYNCLDAPRSTRIDSNTISPDTQHTVDVFSHSSITYDAERGNTVAITNAPVSVSSALLGIGIVGVACLIIAIAIVSVFVVVVRRKKRQQVTDARKTDDGETDGYESIDVNGAHGTSTVAPVSEYCELNVVDRGRDQLDREYLQLNKKQQAKSTDEAKKVDRETDRNKVIDIRYGDQRTSLETSANVYCELDAVPTEGVARESVQCGSEYLQLYEPLVVYEEPQ